ncbi:MAG: hypothetical protein K1X88_12025 [Nannocystaceae bacterium]|nr:hypothetical protein [Nannocystaceae bacterium]
MAEARDGDLVASAADPIVFAGQVSSPGQLVELEAGPTAAGPFSAWPGASTNASNAGVPLPLGDRGELWLYPWQLETTIPAPLWGIGLGPARCEREETYVRVTANGTPLITFAAAHGGQPDGVQCLHDALASTGDLVHSLANCASSSDTVRLEVAPPPHVGDVVIENLEQADALACVQVIEGSLSVAPTLPATLTLPNLREVTGDVTLALPAVPYAPPKVDVRCGALASLYAEIAEVALPELHTIGGDLTIVQTASGIPTTPGEPVELGLPALREVGGDVDISFEIPAVAPCGISALEQLDGDLRLTYATADVSGSLLSSLASVAGQVEISGGYSVLNQLPALVEAGSLWLHDTARWVGNSSLDALARVDGDVVIESLGHEGPLLPSLWRAGALALVQVDVVALAELGDAPLVLDGLSLQSNTALVDLLGAVALQPDAPLSLADNPALDAAAVCSLVDEQAALGWVGAASLGGVVCP